MADEENSSPQTNAEGNRVEPLPTSLFAASEKPVPTPSGQAGLSYFPGWLSKWVPIVTAMVSLIISLFTFVTTRYEPEVLLIMPDLVRIGQDEANGAFIYLQPVFISAGLSERVEVITDIRLSVEQSDQSTGSVEFVWDEQGTWVFDAESTLLNWTFTGDSGPFVVSPKNAQFFTGLFVGPSDWLFTSGSYRITLTAKRITDAQPLRASVEVLLSEVEVEYLNQAQGTQFLVFPAQE